MSKIKYNFLAPFFIYRKRLKLSEEHLSQNAHISRSTLRHIEALKTNLRLESIGSVAEALQLHLDILASPPACVPELSTVGISFQVIQDGFLSWKIHFFNFVDEFRRNLDPRLFLLPPIGHLDFRLKALLASIVRVLALEAHMDAPCWAKKRYFLEKPWFVSETENLKAASLLESPLFFRENNIFVLSNFLERT